jgi:copper chaperone NosL
MLKDSFVKHIFIIASIIVFLSWSVLHGAERIPAKPTPRDKCPVCGMFVYKYPDYLAQITFKDGSTAFFDGPKDMYKYYFNPSKYNPARKTFDIDFIFVTDYYSLISIDGMKAFYVLGSDAYGPMGRELIPFEKETEAREFLRDHKGKSIFRFRDITYPIVKGLD